MGVLLAWLWWRGGILHSKSESGDDMTWDAKGYRLALNGNTFAREWMRDGGWTLARRLFLDA